MLSKLLVPLAIGGGVLLLFASSAKAAPAPVTAFDALPQELRQLVALAQSTNEPTMLDQVAARLEAAGYRDQARVLRAQAEELRRRQPPAMTPSPAPTPPPLPTAPETPRSVPSPPQPQPQAPAMSQELQQMVLGAVANGSPAVLTSTAYVVERAGFPQVAEELRRRAKEAAAAVPPPAPLDRPDVALDPNMPADLALEIARHLQLQGDPNVLDALARQMRSRGFNNTADQLEAKATQIRAALDAARTMKEIDQEFKSPGVAQTPLSAPATAAQPSAPGAGATEVPLTITASPPAPLSVPSAPQPQPPPTEKSKAQILGEAVSTNLHDVLDRYGSVRAARGHEDKALVQRFQSQQRLKTDGLYGPISAQNLALYVSDVPPPFYWRKGATQADLSKYRTNIETLALDAEQLGNVDRAEQLRASAARASLA